MEIKCKLIKELDNGSAIVSMELDEEAKDWLIGEGFTVVLQEAIKLSKTHVTPEILKKHTQKIPKKGKTIPKKGK
jgi:hypothetical protein